MTLYQQQLSLTYLIEALSWRRLWVLAHGSSEYQQQNSHEGVRRDNESTHTAGSPSGLLQGPLLSCARTQHRTPMLAEWSRARPVRYSLSIRDSSDSSEYLHFSCRGSTGFVAKQGECAGDLLGIWTREGQIKRSDSWSLQNMGWMWNVQQSMDIKFSLKQRDNTDANARHSYCCTLRVVESGMLRVISLSEWGRGSRRVEKTVQWGTSWLVLLTKYC